MARTRGAGVRFRQTRWPGGYSVEEVDHFVGLVEAALSSGVPGIRSTDIVARRFTPVQLKPGYDMGEVDDYLEQARLRLRERELEQPPTTQSSRHCPSCRCAELGLSASGDPTTL